MIHTDHGFGAVNVGAWTVRPGEGTAEADPYTRARLAAEGLAPLGAAEGVAFVAQRDDEGRPLARNCTYRLTGRFPRARAWTLAAYGATGNAGEDAPLLRGADDEPAVAVSDALLREADGLFTVRVGPQPHGGNWVPVAARPDGRDGSAKASSGKADMVLVARLYDTPVSSDAELLEPVVPTVVREACG